MKNIYVGNLSFQTTEQDLEAAFSAYGQVERAQLVKDRDTGKSRGFGFVEMTDDAGADRAIEALNGSQLDGRSLTVNEARPREARPSGGAAVAIASAVVAAIVVAAAATIRAVANHAGKQAPVGRTGSSAPDPQVRHAANCSNSPHFRAKCSN